MPRVGWTKRGFAEDDRKIETVGAHLHGTVLLAIIATDLIHPPLAVDEHHHLLRLLATHDIGEAYIGDYLPSDGATKNKEREAVERIASLSAYAGLSAIQQVHAWFEEFESGATRVARLAREIDKLDAILQACKYSEKFGSAAERDHFLNDNLEMIRTAKLRQLAELACTRATAVELSAD